MSSSANPILQAYLQSVQVQHQQDQLNQERELAQQQLDQHQQMIDETAKYHQQDLKMRSVLMKQQMQEHFNNLYGNPSDTSGLPTPTGGGGINLSTPTSTGQFAGMGTPSGFQGPQQPQAMNFQGGGGPSNLPTLPQGAPSSSAAPYKMTPQQGYTGDLASQFPEGFTIDPQYMQKQQMMQLQQGGVDAAVAGMTEAQKAQYQQQVNDAKLLRQHTDAMSEIAAKGVNEEHVANITAGAHMYAANKAYAGRIGAATIAANAKANGTDIDPNELSDVADSVEKAEVPLNQVPSKMRDPVISLLKQRGSVVPATAIIQKALPEAMQMDELMDQYLDTIRQYSSDSPNRSLTSNTRDYLRGTNSALGSAVANLDSQSGLAASQFDKMHRNSDANLLRERKGMYSPYSTVAENMANFNSHIKSLNAGVLGMFPGMGADQINGILMGKTKYFGGAGLNNESVATFKTGDGKIWDIPQGKTQAFLALHKDAQPVQGQQ